MLVGVRLASAFKNTHAALALLKHGLCAALTAGVLPRHDVVHQDVLELRQAQQLVQWQLPLATAQVEQHGVKCIVVGSEDLQVSVTAAGRSRAQQQRQRKVQPVHFAAVNRYYGASF